MDPKALKICDVPVIHISLLDRDTFLSHTKSQEPVIFRGVNVGCCTSKWRPDYLISALGDTEVKVHVCKTAQLDFINKNFLYRSLNLSEYIRRTSHPTTEPLKDYFIDPFEKYYLRSLSADVRKDVSNFQKQFPQIADDLMIPQVFEVPDFFSSVLRIASPDCQLWTHYDVMDNILIQAVGHKKVTLFKPSDVPHLYLQGDKSAVVDTEAPDLEKYPLFQKALQYRCILEPGDVIYIPAFWFHNVVALDFSVAVNVFWKNLDHSLYDNKDTYGNKDLVPASRAQQGIDKAVKTLSTLPATYRQFYLLRIINSLEKEVQQISLQTDMV